MAFNSSWVPDESSQTLSAERSWLQGAIITAIAYGVAVSLCFLSFHLLIREKNRLVFRRRLPLFFYITASFILGTLHMISVAAFTQMAFIDDRNYPGGPDAFETYIYPIPVGDVGRVALVLSNWLSDALVVWRVKVIYQTCGVPMWIVMFFPCLLLAGSVALGIVFLIEVLTTNPYSTNGINFTVPYFSLSLGLNIILTIAIVLRLLRFRYYMVSVLGPYYGTWYTSTASMVIESAALSSAACISFLVLFGLENAVAKVFMQSLNQFQIIASLLIVFRVAQGKGWTEDTAMEVMSVRGLDPSSSTVVKMVRSASSGATVTRTANGSAELMRGRFLDEEYQERPPSTEDM